MRNEKSKMKLYELRKLQSEFPKIKITSSRDSENAIRKFYTDDIAIFESFGVVMLNQANTTLGYAKISQGGITGTIVDVRILAKYAVDSLATSIILFHNHPSGTLKPSASDMHITRKVKDGLGLLYVRVLDHIIITEDSYYSFADNGKI